MVGDSSAIFKPQNVFTGDRKPKWSTRYEDYVLQPHSIRLKIVKPTNNGFYVLTELQFQYRNPGNPGLSDPTKQLLLHPYIYNETWWHTHFMYDKGQTNPSGEPYDQSNSYWDGKWVSQVMYEQNDEIWVHNL